MLNLIRRVAQRLAPHPSEDDRRDRRPHGPFVRMLECDLAHLDRLTWR